MQGETVPALASEMLNALVKMAKEDCARKGPAWCRQHGMGRGRELVGTALPPNVTMLAVINSPERAEEIEELRRAQETFAAVCRGCGGCFLARR